MNVILHVNEIIKTAVVIRDYSLIKVFTLHSASREPFLSERVRKPWKQLVDWRPRKLRFQQTEKTPRGRVLVVTAVNTQKYKNLFSLAKKKRFLWKKKPSLQLMVKILDFNCVWNFWQGVILCVCFLSFTFVWILIRNMFSLKLQRNINDLKSKISIYFWQWSDTTSYYENLRK